jgi:hypothetical protein
MITGGVNSRLNSRSESSDSDQAILPPYPNSALLQRRRSELPRASNLRKDSYGNEVIVPRRASFLLPEEPLLSTNFKHKESSLSRSSKGTISSKALESIESMMRSGSSKMSRLTSESIRVSEHNFHNSLASMNSLIEYYYLI